MQTNCLLQQYVLAGQNPVSSYCLMPPLRFALLFIFSQHSSTILKQSKTASLSKSAERPRQVSQSISVFRQRCQESFLSFFSLLEDLEPSSKVLSCFYHSAIQRVLDFFYVHI